jgi:Protein of unknown function (DUF4089)
MKAFDASAYADAAAPAMDLEVPEHCRPGVATNLERLAAMAEALFRFPIPPSDADDAPA